MHCDICSSLKLSVHCVQCDWGAASCQLASDTAALEGAVHCSWLARCITVQCDVCSTMQCSSADASTADLWRCSISKGSAVKWTRSSLKCSVVKLQSTSQCYEVQRCAVELMQAQLALWRTGLQLLAGSLHPFCVCLVTVSDRHCLFSSYRFSCLYFWRSSRSGRLELCKSLTSDVLGSCC